ncbi:MAG: PmoA family protein, partial [candidate division KSB1 bacterium]|nr:PmoA family protein [candidate division KSB1 bacterium]
RPVACQIDPAFSPCLWWMADGLTKKGMKRIYELVAEQPAPARRLTCFNDGQRIFLKDGDRPLLAYQAAVMPAPEGVSPLFARSGFIHPLWAPGGQVLTRIQPPDHYHHYGIWNPWTKTRFQGREVDFWNIGGGQGTVRFAGVLSTVSGPVFAGFKVRQEHVEMTSGKEIVALNEVWEVRTWAANEPHRVSILDLHTTLSCASDSALILEAYRYGGGIGFRALELWNKDNCSVLTSEGLSRSDADGSRARWCRLEGDDGAGGRMGILFLSFPANREHPEPMRVWPLDANNGRGDLFFEFCPIRHREWVLEPGREYALHYRMVVFQGTLSPEECERFWQSFAHQAGVKVERQSKPSKAVH